MSDHPHSASAATPERFHHDRAVRSEAVEEGVGLVEARGPIRAGNDVDAMLMGESPRRGFIAKEIKHLGAWAHKGNPGLLTVPRKVRVLTEEAVAWVYRVTAAGERGGHQLLDIQIGARPRAFQGAGIVGDASVQRLCVILRIDRYRGDPHLGRGS